MFATGSSKGPRGRARRSMRLFEPSCTVATASRLYAALRSAHTPHLLSIGRPPLFGRLGTKETVIAVKLQGVRQQLVQLGDARRDAEVNGPVANLDDQTAHNVRIDLREQVSVGPVGDGRLVGGGRLTLLVTLSFLPWPTNSDLATAVSSRERVRLSNCWLRRS